MPLFEIPNRATREQDKTLAMKSKKTNTVATIKGGNDILGRINQIKAMVEKKLGKYKDRYIVISTQDELTEYLQACMDNGVISIDTETTGLDPMLDEIAGPCIYTPGRKGAYIPIGHRSYITQELVSGQLSKEVVRSAFEDLFNYPLEVVMFNANFDIRVLRNMLGIKNAYCTWDCYIAARLMNENEPTNALKKLHQKYVLKGQEDAFTFEELFKGIPFTLIPINTGYLYAARDPEITYELYEYQKQFMYYERECEMSDRNGMNGVAWVFFNIEMPCVKVVCDMEDNGILFDTTYQQELSKKYSNILDEKTNQFYTLCEAEGDKIKAYIKAHPDCKLEYPINIASPTQLAILFYDILHTDVIDKKSPRGTGEAILQKIDNPIAKAILEYREVAKLLSTYVDKLPECINPNDGRIHCKFNQVGADTGRMSSSDPNLQNIPSHNKDIRKMFVASPGYVLMSSDFSQQEPKCLAALCKKAGDPQMYDTFMAGKDLYSEIASKAFNKPYEECKEFNPDGTTNKAGKERRTQAKSILLGVLYGRGEASIGEQLKVSTEKAKEIKNSVFRGFPAIKQFEQSSLDMAYELGYVTTVCGRKRRLPDLQLDEYEFKWKDGVAPDNDLLNFEDTELSTEVPENRQNYYLRKLSKCWGKEKRDIFEEANKEGIWIIDNGGKIADATRQCVNSRIQGSAADLTKLAMIHLNNNKKLKELGFRLLVPVHDEVIAECPEENAKECSQLLAQTMSEAAEQILEMPIKCDVSITRCWYGEEVTV